MVDDFFRLIVYAREKWKVCESIKNISYKKPEGQGPLAFCVSPIFCSLQIIFKKTICKELIPFIGVRHSFIQEVSVSLRSRYEISWPFILISLRLLMPLKSTHWPRYFLQRL